MRSSRALLLVTAAAMTFVQVLPAEARSHRRPRRITGTLEIASPTLGAKVYVDGDEVGTIPLAQPIKLLPGPHTVKVVKAGHTQYMETVKIVKGKTVRLEVDLFPVKAVFTLDTAPTDARVYLDGKFIGKTPLTRIEVAPGTHKLRIARIGFYDVIQTVTLTAGKQTSLVYPMKGLPADINPLIPKPAAKRWYEKWWVWASAAGGLVALVVAVAVPVGLSARDPVKAFDAERTFRVPLRSLP